MNGNWEEYYTRMQDSKMVEGVNENMIDMGIKN